jgi:LysR family transcriptional regulator of gallate degradation
VQLDISFYYNRPILLIGFSMPNTAQQLNLRHLLVALETARTGAISKAAQRVHLSQSAVTQALSRLEKALEVALFDRTSTGAMPTAAGRILIHRIERGEAWLRMIEQVVTERGERAPRRLARLLSSTQLRALIAVVQSEHYSRAAQRLGLSQPSLHRAVRDLEAICGRQFFQRAPQGVLPSWQARQVARYANLFFSEINQGLMELKEHHGLMTGSITIGALPLSRVSLVPNAVNQILIKHPKTQVKIIDGSYEEQLSGLLHGQIDVIVGALRQPAPSADIVQERLFSDPLCIVVRPNHPLLRQGHISTAALRELSWIAPRENTPAREVFGHFFVDQGSAPPRDIIECSSLVATRALLMGSDRAALLTARQVDIEVTSNLLAISSIELEGTARDIGITLRKQWQPTKVQSEFLTMLRGAAETSPEQ